MTGQSPSSTAYLGLADRILTGEVPLRGISSARAACWVTRRGLEALLVELLAKKALDVGTANTRSRLICPSSAYADQPDLVTTVGTTWDQLSRACHHHAYDLAPTSGEARHLLAAAQQYAGARV